MLLSRSQEGEYGGCEIDGKMHRAWSLGSLLCYPEAYANFVIERFLRFGLVLVGYFFFFSEELRAHHLYTLLLRDKRRIEQIRSKKKFTFNIRPADHTQ